MSKPTVLIVGGAWHTTDYLLPLAKVFQDEGYSTEPIALHSAGAEPPDKDFSADVAAVRDAATKVIAEKTDVIAILHSLGGIIGSEALHGLGKPSTGGAGVTAIVYIASMVPNKGDNFGDHLIRIGDTSWGPAREAFTQDGKLTLPQSFAQDMFYNDLSPDEAQHWSSLLKSQSVGVYDSKLTHDTYNEIRSGYVLTTLDKAFVHDYQLKTVALRGFPQNKTLTLQTGHSPWLTKPEEIKLFVLGIAGQN